jgi:hypothetical protein
MCVSMTAICTKHLILLTGIKSVITLDFSCNVFDI